MWRSRAFDARWGRPPRAEERHPHTPIFRGLFTLVPAASTVSHTILARSPNSELACVYAALICADDGVEISAENISTIVKAAGVEVESYWPTLFAKLAEKKDIMELVTAVGAGGGGGAVAAAGGAAGAGAAAEAEPEKVEEEEDEDMGFSLFD